MITGEFDFDMHQAVLGALPQYGPAYPRTNEPLQMELGMAAPDGKRVLTVAASGDQPMMYAACGAKHVDTFDLTYNARAVMDLKCAAVREMDFGRYRHLLDCLDYICEWPDHRHQFQQIIDTMSTDTRSIISKVPVGNWCTGDGMGTRFPRNEYSYNLMRNAIKKPFNFIWADLANLHNFLEPGYDIINLSNIFGHYTNQGKDETHIAGTLNNLWPFLNDGGTIICVTGHKSESKLQRALDMLSVPAQVRYKSATPSIWKHIVSITKVK